MKITERQLIVLRQTTEESLKFYDRLGIFSPETRKGIAEEVMNQLTAMLEVKELTEEPKCD